ncbi:MAG: WbqC family protein, partial [Paludibacteraceae bacterium]|nr:WbqC family protein [Paludibacteraceae bacterium]
MMILPTAYMAPEAWYKAFFETDNVQIEVQESFVKQTFRNRCLIHDIQGHEVTLTVPVLKVEHKQLTRDVQVSYQQHWQHQHWMALRSAYG